jgi:hypothetical protein
MATVLDLDQRGDLHLFEALEPQERYHRRIYASPLLRTWLVNTLPTLQSSWGIELSPQEQFADLSELFCAGERLTYETSFKPLTHITDGVWELKTDDIRIFGWFCEKNCFIGAVADDATRIKTHGLYKGYANVTTKQFRDGLDLDNPKFVPGDDPHAVVSNFDYP